MSELISQIWTPQMQAAFTIVVVLLVILYILSIVWVISCLLYTSDAADDGYSVDLGGRRIIKKIFFKQKTAYEISEGLVGSEMCIRDRAY